MQIRTGTASVTNGSQTVVASVGNDWTQAAPNCLFSVPALDGSSVLYTVATTTDPAHSGSGKWELTLSANYAGDTNAAAGYAITKDFSPTLGLALISYGDTDTAILVNRNLLRLEGAINALVTAGNAPPFLGSFAGFTAADAGGGTHVDSVITTGLEAGILYCFNRTEASDPGVKFLFLNTGTDANALPGKFRPLDYAGDNEVFWTIR